ncbi:hypothetical protein PTTG_29202 [Puccinia triticina 1-1 BBBD Race 1]|uniref:CCHC-type domain-containing protein n=1 Tax=Puccinia triticina (isolate 1-1 / race 1 (BBBD)) TaxID=630390 RepID=A0A180G5X3_PUCT1|nr:hypothetical protein PTTG_29202 [Puccinia triticina 1-1 BBBD Race 1]
MVNIAADSTIAPLYRSAIARLPLLLAPSPDSNFLDWELVVKAYFDSAGVDYVIEHPLPERPPPTWMADNKTVCAVITQTIDPANLLAIRSYHRNAYGMWKALIRNHQDLSTGGKFFWLRKLLLARMEGSNVLSHINNVAKSYDCLSSLITPENPLTPGDAHSATLLSSIPDDWMSCVSHLLNQKNVKTEEITLALKNECTRRLGQSNITASASSTKASTPCHCNFCNTDGHNLNNCNNTRKILAKYKEGQKSHSQAKDRKKASRGPSRPAAQAGHTSVATLGKLSHSYKEDVESDFSESDLEVAAGNAVSSLSAATGHLPAGDANINSGCSMSMTPNLAAVENPKCDQTPVCLADHLLSRHLTKVLQSSLCRATSWSRPLWYLPSTSLSCPSPPCAMKT